MTNGLDSNKVKWLTYLVYILLSILTINSGWLINKVFNLHVTKVDQKEFNHTIERIDDKLDNIKDLIYGFHIENNE